MSDLTERLKYEAELQHGLFSGQDLVYMNADILLEAASALEAQEARIAKLEKAVLNAIDLVDRDVICVRPSEQDELLDGLKMWNDALIPSGGK